MNWGEDNKKLKGSGKKGFQSFNDHVYILKGTKGPEKFITWKINIQSTIINTKEIMKMPHRYNILNNILKYTTGSLKIVIKETITSLNSWIHRISSKKVTENSSFNNSNTVIFVSSETSKYCQS